MEELTTDPAMLVKMMEAERMPDGEIVIARTEFFVISLRRMIFNWRLHVASPGEFGMSYAHGYCYFGTGIDVATKAFAAGLEWARVEDPFDVDPLGFDKKAF